MCDLYYSMCSAGVCYIYPGDEQRIHVWSKYVAAGHEIAWDFLSCVRKMKCSFSAFCDHMTHVYSSTYHPDAKFMSKTTFTKWMFSFLASLGIDFRKEVGTDYV